MSKERVDKEVSFDTADMTLSYVVEVAKAAGVDVNNCRWDINAYGLATFNWTEEIKI